MNQQNEATAPSAQVEESNVALMVPEPNHHKTAIESPEFSDLIFDGVPAEEAARRQERLFRHVAGCARFLPQPVAEQFDALVLRHEPEKRHIFTIGVLNYLSAEKRIEFSRHLNIATYNLNFIRIEPGLYDICFRQAYSQIWQDKIQNQEDRKSTRQTKTWGKQNNNGINYGRRAGDNPLVESNPTPEQNKFDDLYVQRIDLSDVAEYERNIKRPENELETEEFARLALMEFVRSGASDFHTECGRLFGKIRFRVDGILFSRWKNIPFSEFTKINNAIAVMAGKDFSDMKRIPVDSVIKLRVNLGGVVKDVEYRFTSQPSQPLPSLVLRSQNEPIRDLTKVGFLEDQIINIQPAIEQPQGIIIVTGPTGGGKTNTLEGIFARLEESDERKIIEIGDPVEIESDGRTQISLPKHQPGGKRPSFTWFDAFTSCLRADPDVIALGELRNTESAKVALDAGLTGHLVLATLHASNVEATFTRLFEMGLRRDLLADGLNLIISQRLVRLLCVHCRKPDETENTLSGHTIYRNDPAGCQSCDSGYHGRTALPEILLVNGQVKQWIRAGENAASIVKRAIDSGMLIPMREVARQKVISGLTSNTEVKRVLELAVDIMDTPDYSPAQNDLDDEIILEAEYEDVK